MNAVGRGLLLLALYLAGVLVVAAVAAWVRRRIPWTFLAAIAALPLLFLAGGVFSEKTLLPVDHALPPWKVPVGGQNTTRT